MLYTTASKYLRKLLNWPYVHSTEKNHNYSLKYFEQFVSQKKEKWPVSGYVRNLMVLFDENVNILLSYPDFKALA